MRRKTKFPGATERLRGMLEASIRKAVRQGLKQTALSPFKCPNCRSPLTYQVLANMGCRYVDKTYCPEYYAGRCLESYSWPVPPRPPRITPDVRAVLESWK